MKIDNPRYLAYCKNQKLSPENCLKRDEKRWPGGVMCGYILWMDKKKSEFRKKHPEGMYDYWLISDQDLFTKFLYEN